MDHWTPAAGIVGPTAGLEQVGRQQAATSGHSTPEISFSKAGIRGNVGLCKARTLVPEFLYVMRSPRYAFLRSPNS
jgi:hypothetical protein